MRLKASWAIDSEAMRARGIIVLVLNPTSWSKISRIKKNSSELKLDFNPFFAPKSLRFSLLVGYNI